MRRWAVLLLLLVSGCGADSVRLQSARAVDTQSQQVAANGAAYLASLQDRRRSADVAFVATDLSCHWGAALYVKVPRYTPGESDARPLCRPNAAVDYYRLDLNATPVGPLPAQLAALAVYEKALADVVGGKPEEAKLALASALSTLVTANGDLSRIAGTTLIPTPQADQLKASADLLTLLHQMLLTHAASSEVAKLVAGFDSKRFLDAMDAAIDRLARLYDKNSSRRIRAALTGLEADHAAGRWRDTDPILLYAARRDLIEALAVTEDPRLSPAKRAAGLKEAVAGLRKADAALREALSTAPSPAVRKQIAEANAAQALDLLAKIAALFPAV